MTFSVKELSLSTHYMYGGYFECMHRRGCCTIICQLAIQLCSSSYLYVKHFSLTFKNVLQIVHNI